MALSLLTLAGSHAPQTVADMVWGVRQLDELDDAARHVALSADDIALLNPNTRSWPVFRTARAAELTRAIYRRVPVLRQQGPSVVDRGVCGRDHAASDPRRRTVADTPAIGSRGLAAHW